MKRAVYPGTFDPFTFGHYDILKRAADFFDEVVCLVAVPPNKSSFLSFETRKRLLSELFEDFSNVRVDTWSGLVVDYLKANDFHAIVRGLRPNGDFESEFQMAMMNRKLSGKAETVFFVTSNELSFVSSSLVKEIFRHGGDVSEFVPHNIANYMKANRDKLLK